jgi:hypothetical protein
MLLAVSIVDIFVSIFNLRGYIPVPLEDAVSSLAPYGQAEKGSSPALLISTIE